MRIVLLTIALSFPMVSYGGDDAASADDTAVAAPAALAKPAALAEPAALGTPVSQETLAEQRGGDGDEVHNDIRVIGEVTDNTAQNVVTGANNIQDGSFGNSSGIFSVVQNTGANVLIQNATIVNVQFAEP